MNHAITWNEYFTVRVLIWAISIIVLFCAVVIKLVVDWWNDCRVNDEPKDGEPYAGKTLGL